MLLVAGNHQEGARLTTVKHSSAEHFAAIVDLLYIRQGEIRPWRGSAGRADSATRASEIE